MFQLKSSWEENEPKNRFGMIKCLFKEFCSNSTIHGVRYFAERRRHWTERLWWLLAFGISVYFCGESIGNMWIDWQGNPVSIGFTEKSLLISEIPFPAITLCPVQEAKTFNNISRDKHPQQTVHHQDWFRMNTLAHLCVNQNGPPHGHGPPFADETIYRVIRDISPNMSDIMHPSCVWQNEKEPCSDGFIPVFTEEGLCYTFNNLNPHEIYTDQMARELLVGRNTPNTTQWSLEGGYKDSEQNNSYPRRVCNAKPSSALLFVLCLNDQIVEYVCDDRIPGFRFFLHMPGEVPAMSHKYYQVSRLEATGVLIKPTHISTSNGLRSFNPKKRQCFFNSERKLRFFKIYTQNNCEAECMANWTQISCGCVRFSMPRDNITRICGTPKINCYRKAEQRMFDEHALKNPAKEFHENCTCLPSCTSITYDAEMDRVNLNNAITPEGPQGPPNKQHKKPCDRFSFSLRSSHVRIFFNQHEVDTLRRSETYTFANFMAICGGLLGLFLGVSVLSIVEFIYFATLRLYWSIHKWKPKNIVVPLQRRPIKHISFDLPNV